MSRKTRKGLGLAAVFLLLILMPRVQRTTMVEEIHVFERKPEKYIIVIDPGHGGRDEGATGASGLKEKHFALSLALKVRDVLESDERIQVFMTRSDDVFISSLDKYRPNFANENQADLFISIHGNSFRTPSVSGTETYYYDFASRRFAQVLHRHIVQAAGLRDRGVRRGDLFVLKYTNMAAVLLEIGYLTNPAEEKLLFDDEFQRSAAKAIARGVKEYLGLRDI